MGTLTAGVEGVFFVVSAPPEIDDDDDGDVGAEATNFVGVVRVFGPAPLLPDFAGNTRFFISNTRTALAFTYYKESLTAKLSKCRGFNFKTRNFSDFDGVDKSGGPQEKTVSRNCDIIDFLGHKISSPSKKWVTNFLRDFDLAAFFVKATNTNSLT